MLLQRMDTKPEETSQHNAGFSHVKQPGTTSTCSMGTAAIRSSICNWRHCNCTLHFGLKYSAKAKLQECYWPYIALS